MYKKVERRIIIASCFLIALFFDMAMVNSKVKCRL